MVRCEGAHFMVSSINLQTSQPLNKGSYNVDFLCSKNDVFTSCEVTEDLTQKFYGGENNYPYYFPPITHSMAGVIHKGTFAFSSKGPHTLLQGMIGEQRTEGLYQFAFYYLYTKNTILDQIASIPLNETISVDDFCSLKVWSLENASLDSSDNYFWTPQKVASTTSKFPQPHEAEAQYAIWKYAVLNSRRNQKGLK